MSVKYTDENGIEYFVAGGSSQGSTPDGKTIVTDSDGKLSVPIDNDTIYKEGNVLKAKNDGIKNAYSTIGIVDGWKIENHKAIGEDFFHVEGRGLVGVSAEEIEIEGGHSSFTLVINGKNPSASNVIYSSSKLTSKNVANALDELADKGGIVLYDSGKKNVVWNNVIYYRENFTLSDSIANYDRVEYIAVDNVFSDYVTLFPKHGIDYTIHCRKRILLENIQNYIACVMESNTAGYIQVEHNSNINKTIPMRFMVIGYK